MNQAELEKKIKDLEADLKIYKELITEKIQKEISELKEKLNQKSFKRQRIEIYNEKYFYIDSSGFVQRSHDDHDNADNYRYNTGNYAIGPNATKELELKRDIALARQSYIDYLRELNEGWEPDWSKEIRNWWLYYDFRRKNFDTIYSSFFTYGPNEFYLKDKSFAEKIKSKFTTEQISLAILGRREP